MSVAYIGPKSRTDWPRKTKIGTEVAHVTRDSDTAFKVEKVSFESVMVNQEKIAVNCRIDCLSCATVSLAACRADSEPG